MFQRVALRGHANGQPSRKPLQSELVQPCQTHPLVLARALTWFAGGSRPQVWRLLKLKAKLKALGSAPARAVSTWQGFASCPSYPCMKGEHQTAPSRQCYFGGQFSGTCSMASSAPTTLRTSLLMTWLTAKTEAKTLPAHGPASGYGHPCHASL